MAISLEALEHSDRKYPPRVLIYGPPGEGKTSLGAQFPNPVLMDLEGGAPSDVKVKSFPDADNYNFSQVLDGIAALITQEHDYQTLIIDSVDKLEPLVWQHVCEQNQWDSIESPGYGKGYIAADAAWDEFIKALRALNKQRNMTTILIGHSTIERFDDPQTASYSRYTLRLHKRAHATVMDLADLVLFVKSDTSIEKEDQGFGKKRALAGGGGTRWMHCEARPSFDAKNRHNMPERLLFKKGEGFSALAPFLPEIKPGADKSQVTEAE